MNTENNQEQALNKTTVSSSLDILHASIWNETPSLIYEDEFEQFDEGSGLRLTHKQVIPEPPMLNDILKWHSLNGRNKYSHFEVIKGEGNFCIYEGEELERIIWDLSKPCLKDQSNELIDWLAELI